LVEEISSLVNANFSLTPHVVHLAPQGSLPRTSSGKPQRRKTKEMYLAGALTRPVAAASETPAAD
jgi:fatty-acyl-CoA synthase